MWNISAKDGIYCNYLKWICSSKEKYNKSPEENLGIKEWNSSGFENSSNIYLYILIYL